MSQVREDLYSRLYLDNYRTQVGPSQASSLAKAFIPDAFASLTVIQNS